MCTEIMVLDSLNNELHNHIGNCRNGRVELQIPAPPPSSLEVTKDRWERAATDPRPPSTQRRGKGAKVRAKGRRAKERATEGANPRAKRSAPIESVSRQQGKKSASSTTMRTRFAMLPNAQGFTSANTASKGTAQRTNAKWHPRDYG